MRIIVIQSLMPSVYRSISCELASPLPPEVRFLMQDFRLIVNRTIRYVLENDLTAKGSLIKLAQMSRDRMMPTSGAKPT